MNNTVMINGPLEFLLIKKVNSKFLIFIRNLSSTKVKVTLYLKYNFNPTDHNLKYKIYLKFHTCQIKLL